MIQAHFGSVDVVARLLQDPRVRATVNLQITRGKTALHSASCNEDETWATSIVHLLLQAGTDPKVTDNEGRTPLAYLRHFQPSRHAAITLLDQAPDAEKASLLVKSRRLAVATISNIVAPSCLQSGVARDEPLPRLALTPVTVQQNNDEDDGEEGHKFRILVAFVLGMEGGWENMGMPRDVFRVVMDLLMPSSAAAEGCRRSPISAGLRREASGDKKKASGESGCRER